MSDHSSPHESGLNGAVVRQIKAERAARGLTVKQLAETSGIPERTLSRYLQAQRALSLIDVERIANGLGMSYETLVGRAWSERREQ